MKNTTEIRQERLGKDVVDTRGIAEGAGQAGIGIIVLLAALIGVWGLACLVGGVMATGVGDLVRGFFSAVIGV
ncbi:hypothetical protein ACHHRT_00895 [Desulfurivibrio sp. D14AmB]|uniref:hypothetical protein n=1 Tax=Desulfurivibrio sp. D14AmB TaxID=3374370 RepID=UPI00376F3F3F